MKKALIIESSRIYDTFTPTMEDRIDTAIKHGATHITYLFIPYYRKLTGMSPELASKLLGDYRHDTPEEALAWHADNPRIDAYEVQTLFHILFGHDRGVGAGHVRFPSILSAAHSQQLATTAHLPFGRHRGVGGRHLRSHLFLAAAHATWNQEIGDQTRRRRQQLVRGARQYALRGAESRFAPGDLQDTNNFPLFIEMIHSQTQYDQNKANSG